MAHYLSVVKKLARGMELCALCGRDITGAPDCVHSTDYRKDNTSKLIDINLRCSDGLYKVIKRRQGSTKKAGTLVYNVRIGMEMLMDLEYLASMPLCDPDSTVRRRNLSVMMRVVKDQVSLMSSKKKED